ncbi:MAG: MATE family efflux transporter [Desulfotomaculum sp.]|nr:MATE family efflux transporter [Desulfotomaculum sp.]MCL0080753.1 MATE family efflux transporter [Peptococcaceae bacterium]
MKPNEHQEREELLNLSMWQLFKKLAIPGMLGMIVVGLYNLMDAVFVGQLIGKEAVGAVALAYIVVLVNQGILMLVGSGSMSLLSIAIGAKDQKTIDKLLGNMAVITVMLSGIFAVIVYTNADWIMYFVGGRGLVHELAVAYVKVLSLGMIFAALGPAMNFLIRGEGKMKTAMIFLGAAGLLNIILNPIFIAVLGMGIEGAAVATIIAQAVLVIIQLHYFASGKSIISLQKTRLKLEKSILPPILKVGSSQMIMVLMAAGQQVLLFRALQHYGGNEHVVLMGAAYRAFTFAFIAIWGLGQGLQPLVGVSYGAKKFKRVITAYKQFSMIGLVFSTAIWALFMAFPGMILSWFITDASLVNMGIPYFRILCAIFLGYIYFTTTIALFIGLGRAKEAAIVAIARQVVFFIPLLVILSGLYGSLGVWIAMPLADFLALVLGLFFVVKIFTKGEFKGEPDKELDQKN